MNYFGICKACEAGFELVVTPREGHDYLPLETTLSVGDCPVCGYSGLDLDASEVDR